MRTSVPSWRSQGQGREGGEMARPRHAGWSQLRLRQLGAGHPFLCAHRTPSLSLLTNASPVLACGVNGCPLLVRLSHFCNWHIHTKKWSRHMQEYILSVKNYEATHQASSKIGRGSHSGGGEGWAAPLGRIGAPKSGRELSSEQGLGVLLGHPCSSDEARELSGLRHESVESRAPRHDAKERCRVATSPTSQPGAGRLWGKQ